MNINVGMDVWGEEKERKTKTICVLKIDTAGAQKYRNILKYNCIFIFLA